MSVEEVAKLKEVFEFGFITREEYEVRLRDLGVNPESESPVGISEPSYSVEETETSSPYSIQDDEQPTSHSFYINPISPTDTSFIPSDSYYDITPISSYPTDNLKNDHTSISSSSTNDDDTLTLSSFPADTNDTTTNFIPPANHIPQEVGKTYKIFQVALPPQAPNSCNDGYFSELYYLDAPVHSVVVYFKNLCGVFQTEPLTNPTLDTILNKFGISNGNLIKVDTKEHDTSPDNETPQFSVSPGHYILVQDIRLVERGSWQMRIDRDVWNHSYDPFAHKAYLNQRWPKQEEIERAPWRPTKCIFLGDSISQQFMCHFFIRLRYLESMWMHTHETQAVKKLKQCCSESKCYFCDTATASTAPFCGKHFDTELNKLAECLMTSAYWKSEFPSSRGDDVDAAQERKAAQLSYESHIKKNNQYCYLDPSIYIVQKKLTRYMVVE